MNITLLFLLLVAAFDALGVRDYRQVTVPAVPCEPCSTWGQVKSCYGTSPHACCKCTKPALEQTAITGFEDEQYQSERCLVSVYLPDGTFVCNGKHPDQLQRELSPGVYFVRADKLTTGDTAFLRIIVFA